MDEYNKFLNNVENNNNNNNNNNININSNPSNMNKSNIPNDSDKFTNTQNMNSLKQKLSEADKNKGSYLCQICSTFPLIKIVDGKTIIVKCEDEENDKKSFEKMFKYKIKPLAEELKKYTICQEHNKVYQCYCLKCEKNKCEDCYELARNLDHDQNNDYKRFKLLDEEIKYMENYVKNIFEKYNKDELDKKNIEKNKKPQNHLEDNKIIKDIYDKDGKIVGTKMESDSEIFLDIKNIEKLFNVLIYNKKQYPNYKHYLNIENIYYYLCDKLDIEYFSYLNQSERNINIFGKKFVENNRKNCCLMINNKKVKLREDYHIEEDKKLEITLVKKKPITNMSEMFKDCDSLFNIKVNKHWAMDDITEMYSMFYKCISLKDINEFFSDCNTSKVSDFSNMFYKCECLRNIKYISNFNISNATNLSNMFYGCLNLLECDLTEWKTDNVSYMSYMFSGCENLKTLIGIDKWNTENVIYMNNTFENCENLKVFSDISKWKIRKDIDMNKIFNGFSTLVEKPNWNKENI